MMMNDNFNVNGLAAINNYNIQN